MRYKSSLFLTTWLPVLLANNNPQITQNIQPRYGSLRGETLIRIRGKNFSPNKFDLNDPSNPDVGNRVYLFNDNYEFECDVQVDDSTTDQIMCRTPNNMDTNWEWLSVKVKSDGKWSNVWGWRGFQPRNDRTPYVHHITPTVMEPQSVIRQYGNQYTRSYNSTNTNWPNSKSCPDCAITKIWVGGKECDLYNRTLVDFPRDVYEINMVATKDADGNDIEGSEGRTTNEGYFKCRLTGTKVDYQNFTYIVDQDYGRSRMNRLRKRLAPRGTIYDLQTYAKVDSIENPVSGSNGGGQLKIRGNWFSPLDKDHKVFIDDQECENVQVSEQGTLLTCNPKAGTPSDAETLYEGNRGLFWSIYSGFAGDDATYQSIKDKLEDANDPPTHTMQKFVNGDLVNNDAHFIEAFSAYSAAFFKPVLDSQYQWQLESTDDYGEIYFGDTGSFEDLSLEVQNKLDNSVRKNSAHFDLIGGKSYPIEFFTRDGGGPNFFKPKIMQRDTTWNHQGYHYASNHKQQIQASVAHRNEVQTVTFNNLSPNNLMPYEGTNSSAKICFMCNEPKDNTNPNICDFKMQILGYLTPEFSLTDGLDSAISDALTHHNGRFMSEGNFEVTDYSCRENGAVGIEISHMRTDSIQIIADPALEYEIEYTEGTEIGCKIE